MEGIVYVYAHSKADPAVQSLYSQIYDFVPEQTGSGSIVGPVIMRGVPHELFTAGGVGIAWASLTHDTVDPSSGGKVNAAGYRISVNPLPECTSTIGISPGIRLRSGTCWIRSYNRTGDGHWITT